MCTLDVQPSTARLGSTPAQAVVTVSRRPSSAGALTQLWQPELSCVCSHCKMCLTMPVLCRYLAATWAVLLIIGPFFTGHLRPSDTMKGRASMLANMR